MDPIFPVLSVMMPLMARSRRVTWLDAGTVVGEAWQPMVNPNARPTAGSRTRAHYPGVYGSLTAPVRCLERLGVASKRRRMLATGTVHPEELRVVVGPDVQPLVRGGTPFDEPHGCLPRVEMHLWDR